MAELGNPKNTIEVLQKYQFHFAKKFGQNFLIDTHVLDKIVRAAEITPEDYVLEIGPGIGTLTQYLCESAKHVFAVEIDDNLIPILQDTLSAYDNVTVIHNDVLKLDINKLVEEKCEGKRIKVVANLPYYITTPIIMGLFESGAPIDNITVMVQKEVAEKLTAPVGTREAGAITVAVQYYGTVTQLFSVSRGSFLPPPNVDSAVIQIQLGTPYAEQVADEKHFFQMVRSGFSQRRKTLVNALSATMGYEKAVVSKALTDCGLSETVRMESLSMEQLIALHRALLEA